jgi:glutamate-5-semialdehyde dehydrogenase
LPYGEVVPATEADFATEYLSLPTSPRPSSTPRRRPKHIRRYSTGHSETIVTGRRPRPLGSPQRWTPLRRWSTPPPVRRRREFGFGAERISTQKLHARGPMGLPEMTSSKYIVTGSGQTR